MADENRPADPMPVPVDESHILATYANFCRVTGTPEELIVDFGLNKQVAGTSPDTIQLTQRIIVNFFTAKRLAAALAMAVARHEQAFGPGDRRAAADRAPAAECPRLTRRPAPRSRLRPACMPPRAWAQR